MHFPIIEINRIKKTKEEIKDSFIDYDDATLNYFCDYFGEAYTPSERHELIFSDAMKELFADIAKINLEDESVTFYSKETIHETLRKDYRDILYVLEENKNVDGYLKFYLLRQKGNEFRDSSILFILDGAAYTSMQFFEDAYHYAGQTLYFGQVFDAHC